MPDIKLKIGKKEIVFNAVQRLRVPLADGTGKVDFFFKDGTYNMEHGGVADVGEYSRVSTSFPEYTAELQTERADLINMVGQSVDDEIQTLEEAYNYVSEAD